MVSGTISLFCPKCFSPFPHGTCSLSVSQEYLALPGGPGKFIQGSSCPVLLRVPLPSTGHSPTWLSHAMARFSILFGSCLWADVAALLPRFCLNKNGLGWPPFARRYLGDHFCFLFLRLLRCFSSPGWPRLRGPVPSARGVGPFGDYRVYARLQLSCTFRSLSRPSSPLRA